MEQAVFSTVPRALAVAMGRRGLPPGAWTGLADRSPHFLP